MAGAWGSRSNKRTAALEYKGAFRLTATPTPPCHRTTQFPFPHPSFRQIPHITLTAAERRMTPQIPSTCDSLMAGRFSFGFWCWWALANLARCGGLMFHSSSSTPPLCLYASASCIKVCRRPAAPRVPRPPPLPGRNNAPPTEHSTHHRAPHQQTCTTEQRTITNGIPEASRTANRAGRHPPKAAPMSPTA